MLSQLAIQKYGHHVGNMIMNDDRGNVMANYHDFTRPMSLSYTSCGPNTTRDMGHFSLMFQ